MKLNTKMQALICQYREIIRRDGEISDEDLKMMLKLDEEVADEYKTDDCLPKIIKRINDKKYFYNVSVTEREPCNKIKPLHKDFMRLYKKELTDVEIASALGTSPTNVNFWRKANNLKSNSVIKRNKKYEKVKILYSQGLKDEEIAEELKMDYSSVGRWRRRNKLMPNK